jgi:hypothetical protein
MSTSVRSYEGVSWCILIIRCESGVESEKEHRGGEPTKRVNQQSPVRTHLRGLLNTGFLIGPVEQGLDGLPDLAYGLGKQVVCRRKGLLAFFLLGPESVDRGSGLRQVAL